MMHNAWTDYPLKELGDTPGQEAPVRQVEVLGYDGDKYLTVRVGENFVTEVKRFYVYAESGRFGTVPVFNVKQLKDPFAQVA